MFQKIKSAICYFSKGELALWGISVCCILLSFLLFDRENYFTLLSSLIGVTSLIFCAKGHPFGQLLIILFSLLYGAISFTFAYYGEMITYLGMTLPMAVFSWISWLKNPYNGNKAQVKINKLNRRETVFMFALTAAGIPCAGEGDIKTGVAMKICDILNTGGSFCEIVATDYLVGTIILGHDGPFHIKISDGKPVLRGMGVYHGKKGSGISVEANVVAGDVTLLGLTQTADGNLRMIISEAEAIRHPILTIGNTQTHVRFQTDPDSYMDQWFRYAPTHHLAMSVGKNAALFEKTAKLLLAEYVIL